MGGAQLLSRPRLRTLSPSRAVGLREFRRKPQRLGKKQKGREEDKACRREQRLTVTRAQALPKGSTEEPWRTSEQENGVSQTCRDGLCGSCRGDGAKE